METLALIGLFSTLPLALFNLAATLNGNKILGFFILKLPALISLFMMVIVLLKKFNLI